MMMSEREISHFLGGTHEDDPPDTRITIEEGLDCRRDNLRFFNIRNQDTNLSIVISHDSSIIGCNQAGEEIVVDRTKLIFADREAHCYDDMAPVRMSWNCHVRGRELSFTSSNNNCFKLYELKSTNELTCLLKQKTLKVQNRPTYFNLNNASDENASIDGHTITVQCNGNMNRIMAQNTRCSLRDIPSTLPNSLIGEIPLRLVKHQRSHLDTAVKQNNHNNDKSDQSATNLIVCDAIFSLEANSSLDYLKARVQFRDKSVELRLSSSDIEPAQSQAGNSNTSGQEMPSSSKKSSSSISSSSFRPSNVDNVSQKRPASNDDHDYSTTSSSATQSINSSNQAKNETTSGDIKTTLRLRVRITNFGVAMMPILMKTYMCRYNFDL